MIRKNTFTLILIFILSISCSKNKSSNNYLKKVLDNLDKIESATYYTKSETWNPGDTVPAGISYSYVKEYNNPSDSTIGASYVRLNQKDTTKLITCYDGNMRTIVYDDEKRIVVDSFKVRPLPFRPISPPFFNYTKNIIRYALETKDSISLELEDLKESVFLKLTIYEDRQVEFFGKAYYMPNTPYNYGETTSRYEIWINRSNDLPYKVRREMSHNISVISCSNIKLNKIKIENFNAFDYFPPGYSIQLYKLGGRKTKESEMVGKVAPEWVLVSTDNKTIDLKKIMSKVVMIQFTSVSCGPCRASIPFLKQLVSEYDKKDFEFVSIEGFTKNLNVLRMYQDRNNFNYPFLMSTKDVTKSYRVQAVPVFYILDENRVIKKVIRGYEKGTTDKKIKEAINELI